MEMFRKFHSGDLNLSRLNYGLISFIPKLKEATNIRHYRPICVLNVDYRWFTKVLTKRLTRVANSIISNTQTTLMSGRNILEGVVVLHETIHELKRKKERYHIEA
jgi:hypothetical protein